MLKDGIFWVGAIDWDLRTFHGYKTQRGSTYNSYLILDEKTVLVDTVKKEFFEEMLKRIKDLVDPSTIDIIVSEHVEMDHSGCLPMMREIAPDAKIITSTRGKEGLQLHYHKDWDLTPVASGDTLNIGSRNLQFIHMPMVHWPDNMATYIPEDKVLLSNDAFGQHIARADRFDDDFNWDILKEEAGKYFANIVLPYCKLAKKALKGVDGLDIDIIGPSHGAIWRSYVPNILAEYKKWVNGVTDPKALIVYDTMWGSTEKMAYSIREGLLDAGIRVTLRNLKTTHISDILTDVLTSKMILLGSSTINNGMLWTMGAFLTYLKGLRPKDRIGMAFGSFGWGGQAVGEIEGVMEEIGWTIPKKGVRIKYIPQEDQLDEMKAIGMELAKHLKEPDDKDGGYPGDRALEE